MQKSLPAFGFQEQGTGWFFSGNRRKALKISAGAPGGTRTPGTRFRKPNKAVFTVCSSLPALVLSGFVSSFQGENGSFLGQFFSV